MKWQAAILFSVLWNGWDVSAKKKSQAAISRPTSIKGFVPLWPRRILSGVAPGAGFTGVPASGVSVICIVG